MNNFNQRKILIPILIWLIERGESIWFTQFSYYVNFNSSTYLQDVLSAVYL